MPTKKNPPRLNLLDAQRAAQAYIRHHFETKRLGLPEDLTEAQFTAAMDAIRNAMLAAWGDGHYHGVA
jgi:hypothetical protein